MSKIRINDLARELEVKSKSILDVLPEIGVTEKKSHSSSLEDHEADKVRARLRSASPAQTSSRICAARPRRCRRNQDQDRPFPDFQTRRRIKGHHQQATGSCRDQRLRQHQRRPVETKTAVAPAPPAVRTPPPAPPSAPAAAPPRLVVPTSTPRPTFTVPAPPAPPQAAAPVVPAPPVAPKPPVVSPAAQSPTAPAVTTPRPAAPPVPPPPVRLDPLRHLGLHLRRQEQPDQPGRATISSRRRHRE